LLSRINLIEKLQRGQAGKLTLLHGASGTGKTTLLALWRRYILTLGKRAAWLTLTKEERLTGRFFSSLVTAIEKATPEIGKGLRLLLTAGDGVSGKLLAAALINDIALHENINIVLMLDNYEEIVDSEVEDSINFLLENLPVNFHLIISSGTWPGLSLIALRNSSQLVEVSTYDLLLDVAEVEDYVRDVGELELDDAACRSLHDKTEGWITGIQLALSTVKKSNSPQHKLSYFSANWDAVQTYFDEVVLARQPTHIIDFLHECCLLKEFNEDLCVSVHQSLNAAENIAYLKRHNLFCYEEKNSFRFFKLFADALQERAKGIPQDKLIEVHRRATYWYAKKEQWNEAVQYALNAGDTGLALGYIDQCAMKLVEHGDINTLYDWIVRMEAVPGNHSLTLRIAEVWVLSFLFRFDEVNKLLLELEQQATSGSFDFNDSMLAALVSIRAMIHAFNDDFDEADRLTASFNENTSDLTPWLGGVICNILVMISIYREDSSKSLHYQEVIASRSHEQNVFVRIYSDVLIGLIFFKKAELGVAKRYYQKALTRAENKIGHRSLGASLAVSYITDCLY
jgi:ATP/maltotriose-dependent transcriptional regulator MalT